MAMQVKVDSEQSVLWEGEAVLVKHLGLSKAARFLAAWRQGVGDYLEMREEMFAGETVDTLYDKILQYQRR